MPSAGSNCTKHPDAQAVINRKKKALTILGQGLGDNDCTGYFNNISFFTAEKLPAWRR